ncbi:MAG: type II toxin-antitoxin system HicA family toxin [Verrucomicrobia bacterium]|nr:type II toxin-antitoxin system HicA family toxin [Verrucomicrobiota bacterium]
MPKLPPIGSKKCIAALQALGFSVIRQKGSHIVMRRGESECVVPNHKV